MDTVCRAKELFEQTQKFFISLTFHHARAAPVQNIEEEDFPFLCRLNLVEIALREFSVNARLIRRVFSLRVLRFPSQK